MKKYQLAKNQSYIQAQQTVIQNRKETFVYEFNGDILMLSTHLMSIFNQQKFTFKLSIQFSYMLIKVEEGEKKNDIITVEFDIHYASTQTRLKDFKNPVVVDIRKDIDDIV